MVVLACVIVIAGAVVVVSSLLYARSLDARLEEKCPEFCTWIGKIDKSVEWTYRCLGAEGHSGPHWIADPRDKDIFWYWESKKTDPAPEAAGDDTKEATT